MGSFVARFLGFWLAAVLVGLARVAVTFPRLTRDPYAHAYVRVPVLSIAGYAALAALVLATTLQVLMRWWRQRS